MTLSVLDEDYCTFCGRPPETKLDDALSRIAALEAELTSARAALQRSRDAAESLARDLVQRNLELGRVRAAAPARATRRARMRRKGRRGWA